MKQTVLGVYDSYTDACSAQRALGEAGVAPADIAVYSMSVAAPVEKGPRVYAPGSGSAPHRMPVFEQLDQLFAQLFKQGEYPPETEDYKEFIRRGGAIVSADVSDTQVDLTRDVMRRAGAADIDERSSAWWRESSGMRASRDDFPKDYDTRYAKSGAPDGQHVRGYVREVGRGQGQRDRRLESGWERFKGAVRHGWERVTRH